MPVSSTGGHGPCLIGLHDIVCTDTSCLRGNRTIVSPPSGLRKIQVGRSLQGILNPCRLHGQSDSGAGKFSAKPGEGAQSIRHLP